MKRIFIVLGVALLCTGQAGASEVDTLKVAELSEVVVKGVKAQKDAPFAVSNINKQQLSTFATTAQELPFLFAQTPGVLAWSENGLGIGTTYMRIRGAGDSRINVTLDGVQLNSPEDECVWWANMSSYASLLNSAQIQRGVGTSTNGDGAFGGTIALTTKAPQLEPGLELTSSYGSYGTYRLGANGTTGLLWNHFVADGAWNYTSTDGYMDGTNGEAGSFMIGLAWVERNWVLRYRNIGNWEHMGQAWNGVDTGDLLDGNYGMSTGLNSYRDFYNAGMGKYNSLYESMNDSYDPSAGFSRYTMNDGSYWPQTTDNFWQDHNLLSLSVDLAPTWQMSLTAHYTYGYGYYEEFRYNNKLSKFGISNYTLSDGSTLKKTDFVRQKGLEQHTYGGVWNISHTGRVVDFVGGASLQNFEGNHFGYLTYIANEELAAAYLSNGRYTYYDSDAQKLDGNAFAKFTVKLSRQWSLFADAQYRYVHYQTSGINDKFYSEDSAYYNQELNINKHYNFFNPKAGVSYKQGGNHAYASVAVSHREPERNNFTDNGSYDAPKAETLIDFELGYSYTGSNWNVGVNAYYMKYDNQFVQTGEVSDIGESLTTNIKDSYRAGVELTAAWELTKHFSLFGNAALSQNKIKDFDEVVEDWDNGSQTIHYDNSTLAFSPSAILNGFASLHFGAFNAIWHTNFVSKQYLDNTACDDRSLPSYSQSNLSANYTMTFSRCGIKSITLGAALNNVFNKHYAASAWVYSAIYESGGHSNDNRYREIGYIPMAGRNIMANATIKF